ncbi:MAG: Uma2 family endonuclease [Oscillatoriaceae cyanobacterium Prado104]|jgi:Uma2 family endonuclease|nr:Uma2 family endonuclease [Oscillatoriaceae cyanobacterium Prado104]
MYDLPSEHPEDSGLPDLFHLLQSRGLEYTFFPRNYPSERVFVASDLNLYFDVNHPQWYKRPDWFAVVGVDRLYQQQELRKSYVIWQEEVSPFVVVELLSPGTENEDLGQTIRGRGQPPTKWQVYEQILRVPYYIVYDGTTNILRAFVLRGDRYEELILTEPRIWMPEIELGLGIWQGTFEGVERLWLRWYDASGNWILTPTEQECQEKEIAQQQAELEAQRAEQERQEKEIAQQQAELERQRAEQERQEKQIAQQQAEQERQRAELERQRAERLAEMLRLMNIDPDEL